MRALTGAIGWSKVDVVVWVRKKRGDRIRGII